MGSVAVILNLVVLSFTSYELLTESYKFLKFSLFSNIYYLEYKFVETLYYTIPLIILSLMNICLILKIIEKRLISNLVLIINFIIFLFFLFVIYIGISDEFSPSKIEKTKLFFSFENYQIMLLILFGIILPMLCITLIPKKLIN